MVDPLVYSNLDQKRRLAGICAICAFLPRVTVKPKRNQPLQALGNFGRSLLVELFRRLSRPLLCGDPPRLAARERESQPGLDLARRL